MHRRLCRWDMSTSDTELHFPTKTLSSSPSTPTVIIISHLPSLLFSIFSLVLLKIFGGFMDKTLESGLAMEPRYTNPDPSVTAPVLSDDRRVEIDTSAPFESVREAATRFGGIGFWRPSHHRIPEASEEDVVEDADIAKLEDEAAELEKDLIVKERETLEVLKELETTKSTVEELKLKLHQKENSEASNTDEPKETENENCGHGNGHPGEILVELNQAKLNLSRTTNDLADIRASVEFLNKKLEKERTSLEKTRERLTQNSLKVSSLEKELKNTKTKLKFAKEPEISDGSDNPSEISNELQRLGCEAEKFKKMGANARSVVFRAMSEIEQTKNQIKTAEIRFVAARKMKEAARAAEAVALAEIKAVSKTKNSAQNTDALMTISVEEYTSLTQKANDAKEKANKRVEDAMSKVDEANVSKKEILNKVDEAAEEIKTSKRALEEALERVEAANNAKLEVEEALRKWRSEGGGQRRRSSSVNNTAKFKNPCPPQFRRESRLLDVNGLNLTNCDPSVVPVLRPTMSIGQILSRKLLLADESEMNILGEKRKVSVSLGQMLGNSNPGNASVNKKKTGKENGKQQFTGKRKKFGLMKFSVLLNKESKKKKKVALNLR